MVPSAACNLVKEGGSLAGAIPVARRGAEEKEEIRHAAVRVRHRRGEGGIIADKEVKRNRVRRGQIERADAVVIHRIRQEVEPRRHSAVAQQSAVAGFVQNRRFQRYPQQRRRGRADRIRRLSRPSTNRFLYVGIDSLARRHVAGLGTAHQSAVGFDRVGNGRLIHQLVKNQALHTGFGVYRRHAIRQPVPCGNRRIGVVPGGTDISFGDENILGEIGLHGRNGQFQHQRLSRIYQVA